MSFVESNHKSPTSNDVLGAVADTLYLAAKSLTDPMLFETSVTDAILVATVPIVLEPDKSVATVPIVLDPNKSVPTVLIFDELELTAVI